MSLFKQVSCGCFNVLLHLLQRDETARWRSILLFVRHEGPRETGEHGSSAEREQCTFGVLCRGCGWDCARGFFPPDQRRIRIPNY